MPLLTRGLLHVSRFAFVAGETPAVPVTRSLMPIRFSNVTMDHARVKPVSSQPAAECIRDHHGPMTSASAANSHRHIRLSFAFVQRQQIVKQITEAAAESPQLPADPSGNSPRACRVRKVVLTPEQNEGSASV